MTTSAPAAVLDAGRIASDDIDVLRPALVEFASGALAQHGFVWTAPGSRGARSCIGGTHPAWEDDVFASSTML